MRVQGGIILILLHLCIPVAVMVHRGVHHRIPLTTHVSSSNLVTSITTFLHSSILVSTPRTMLVYLITIVFLEAMMLV
jgi:hypothetical protein